MSYFIYAVYEVYYVYCIINYTVYCSVADPDLKDTHHFAGSGSIIFFMNPDPDPDPDLNLAHPTTTPILLHT